MGPGDGRRALDRVRRAAALPSNDRRAGRRLVARRLCDRLRHPHHRGRVPAARLCERPPRRASVRGRGASPADLKAAVEAVAVAAPGFRISWTLSMGTARLGWSSALTLSLLLLALPAVAVEGGADAREIYEQATAAFGLGHYAAAAEKYEAAFSLRPDPALLYNAAQSYRLAGNKPRALELYRNCLRLYPNFHNAEDARRQVTNLKAEIEQEQSAKTATAPVPRPVAV